MGFDAEAVDLVAALVRWHLLLAETATTRDPDDPATIDLVTARLGSVEALELLLALTEADARATAPKAWSSWRSGLVRDLARRARVALDTGAALPAIATEDVEVPKAVRKGGISLAVEAAGDGSRVTVVAPDRVGLLADLAATFALARVPVRAARAWAQEQYAVSVWEVGETGLDAAVLRQRYDGVVDGRLDAARRLRPGDGTVLEPTVVVRPEASDQATVLEVRTADRPGVVYLVCAALARLDVAVRSAHVDTLGPQAVDVFYLQESGAGALPDTRAAEAAHAVRAALSGAATPPG
jgi:[protein-PII] uridylyltransferase